MTLAAAQQAKAKLETTLSAVAGYPVEITIRGERAFTFSFDAIDPRAGQKLAAFMGATAKTSIATDAELEMTFVYVEG